MKAAVFGASGYGGMVLMRLLMDHPEITEIYPVSTTTAGEPVDNRDGGLGPDPNGKLPVGRKFMTREDALGKKPDAVFSALPHGASAEFCEPFFGKSVIFDLSADFRLDDPDVHKKAYGADAPFPALRGKTVYGLSEIYTDKIKTADIIAVPGCYPTCTLLPLIPLAKHGLIDNSADKPVVVNAASGISGAGRSAKTASLYTERSENFTAYNPGRKHRHLPEIEQELSKAAGYGHSSKENYNNILFTPHLAPMRRGMAVTTVLQLSDDFVSENSSSEELNRKLQEIYLEAYGDKTFINIRGNNIPSTRDVAGSNRCDIGWAPEKNAIILFSVIDNLVKGASGQAVQDFNIRFGFPETTGLPIRGEA